MMVDAVEKKLDMTLEQIEEQRRASASAQTQPPLLPSPVAGSSNGSSGKSRNTKRSDRLAQAGPYPSRSARGTEDGNQVTAYGAGRRVYVGNLPWSVQWTDLKDHMRAAGEVLHATILEANGRSKGCGLVEFANEEDAQRAIATLNDTEMHGRKIFVREDREAQPQPQFAPPPVSHHYNSHHAYAMQAPPLPPKGAISHGTRVYVGNLSWNVKWQELKDHMKAAGNVMHADVLEEPSGRSKGCGLVEYSSREEAQHAIATLNDSELEGRKIFVREDREPEAGSISSLVRRVPAARAGLLPAPGPRLHQIPNAVRYPPAPPPQNFPIPDGTSLYVGNLSWEVSWQTLKDFFRTVGEVDRAEIAQFPDGRSRGFGIVRFVHPEDAARAIGHLNGSNFLGRAIEVRYDKGRS